MCVKMYKSAICTIYEEEKTLNAARNMTIKPQTIKKQAAATSHQQTGCSSRDIIASTSSSWFNKVSSSSIVLGVAGVAGSFPLLRRPNLLVLVVNKYAAAGIIYANVVAAKPPTRAYTLPRLCTVIPMYMMIRNNTAVTA